eukprot:scaffold9176_cov129-Cylindrotheca_fusiformis.AAC.9
MRLSQFSFSLLIVLFASIVATMQAASTRKLTSGPERKNEILLVFSDLDGTLIHYPDVPSDEGSRGVVKLPPSSTGMRGEISSNTMSLAREIRNKGRRLILISGMRTTTLFSRLPYLPRADAYCSEGGGRIFYPTNRLSNGFRVTPKEYDGAPDNGMEDFCVVEDMKWRQMMEMYTGRFVFDDPYSGVDTSMESRMELRDGVLWKFAQFLIERGFVLDTKGYSACFRVNSKQQTSLPAEDFQALLDGTIEPFEGLQTSVNLNCIDVYPLISGKKNCCQYLAEKFCTEISKSEVLSAHAVCICDDDNDIEMALACRHAFIPSISSTTMAQTIRKFSTHFTVTGDNGSEVHGTKATDLALQLILDSLADAS